MFFKKRDKYKNSKFKKGEFVSFHNGDDLIFGIVKEVKKEDNTYLYDIMVGGEATWLAEDILEKKLVRVTKGNA